LDSYNYAGWLAVLERPKGPKKWIFSSLLATIDVISCETQKYSLDSYNYAGWLAVLERPKGPKKWKEC